MAIQYLYLEFHARRSIEETRIKEPKAGIYALKEVSKMPRGDGTGPSGRGPGNRTGSRRGSRGRGDGLGAGPGGSCICPDCGEKVPHQQGVPCYEQRCPKCGIAMTRE